MIEIAPRGGKQLRRRVYVSGGTINSEDFRSRGLQEVIVTDDFAASYTKPDARAIVHFAGNLLESELRPKLVSWLRRNVEPAINRGLLCVIATLPGQNRDAQQIISNFAPSKRNIRVLEISSSQIAQACAVHDPGAYPDPTLSITTSDGTSLKEEIDLLLRRAFTDFQSLTLTPLTGGRSQIDGVWRANAESADSELRSPFVIKCGSFDHISEQINTYRDVVSDRVPFRGCAPLCMERSVAGFNARISVSRFVEDAVRFDEFVLAHKGHIVRDLIAHIYTGPLGRWRAAPRFKEVTLLKEFIDNKHNFIIKLQSAHRKLKRGGLPEIHSPAQIFRILESLPKTNLPVCRAHDDLNLRNIFVSSAQSEIILIDFTRAKVRPLSRDIARLDVGLAFDRELNEKQPLDESVLIDFFTGELFAISLPHMVRGIEGRTRLRAIESLRQRMIGESAEMGYDPSLEYKVAVIAELLYQAKYSDNLGKIAYQCAATLTQSLTPVSS